MKNQLEKIVLTDEETLTEVVNCLAQHIPINSTGAGDPQNLFKVLVRAASNVYVTYKVKTSLNHIHQCYRQRFAIETSYRMKNLCRIRTTTKKPTLRLLFVGISFLLVNIWVNLLWRKISKPRKGGRLIYRTIFPLKQMLSFLNQAVERIF